MKFNKTLIYTLLPFILIGVAVVFLMFPYFHSGYFPTHDGEWAVVRLGDMFREVRDGQIPARFSGNLNFGYGYPLFNFAYPLPYYAGLPLLLMHLGLVGSIKILFVGSVLLSLVGMYLLAHHMWESKVAGVVAAVCYAFFPYRMVDLYVRGSLGETMASALFPFILLCFLLIYKSKRKILPALCAGVCFGLLILAHNIMAVLFLFVLIPFLILLFFEKKENGVWFVGSMLYGFTLSAFFWIPALVEKHFITLSQTPIADRNLYFVTMQQLLFSPFGYAPPTQLHGFTYQIGWPQLAILFLSILFVFHWGRKNNKLLIKHSALLLSSIAILCVGMLFSFSAPLWHMPVLSEINYPWTLLLPIGFIISLLSGYLITQVIWVRSVAILCVALAIVLYLPWARPMEYIDRGEGFYLTNDATTTSSDELMPLWVKKKPSERTEKVSLLSTSGELKILENMSNQLTFISNLSVPSRVQINTIYYPGWRVLIDGKPTTFSYFNEHGVMQLSLPQGTHTISALFSETPIRLISNYLSLVSILLFPLVVFYRLMPKKINR